MGFKLLLPSKGPQLGLRCKDSSSSLTSSNFRVGLGMVTFIILILIQEQHKTYVALLKKNSALKFKVNKTPSRLLRIPDKEDLRHEIDYLERENSLLTMHVEVLESLKTTEFLSEMRQYRNALIAIEDLNDASLDEHLKSSPLDSYFDKSRDGRNGIFHFIRFDSDSEAVIAYKLQVMVFKLATLSPSILNRFEYLHPGLVDAALDFIGSLTPISFQCLSDVEKLEIEKYWEWGESSNSILNKCDEVS